MRDSVLKKWAKGPIRHFVLIFWLVISAAGFASSFHLGDHLTTALNVPGSESERADQLIRAHFGSNIEGTFTVIYKFKQSTPKEIDGYKASVLEASKVIPGAEITQSRAFGGVLFANVSTPYALVEAAGYAKEFRSELRARGLDGVLVTGPPAIEADVTPVLADDLHRGEVIAIVLALLLLILVLGLSWAVFIPLIFASATITTSLGIIYLLAQKFTMVLYIPNIVELIGLGLAIDYSLLLVHRMRKELKRAASISEAIWRTMSTAGRTVVTSGLSVAVGLTTLYLVPVPFVRSLGTAGLVVPIVSVIATLTLAPALLTLFGRSGLSTYKFDGVLDGASARFFTTLTTYVLQRPLKVFLSSLVGLLVFISSVLWLETTPSSLTAIPAHLESAQAVEKLTAQAGPGVITPHELLIDLGAPGLALTSHYTDLRHNLTDKLVKDPEIFVAASDTTTSFIDSTGQYIRIFIFGRHDLGSKQTQDLVHRLRTQIIPDSGFPSTSKLYLGGAPAQGVDLLAKIFGAFPWIVALALLIAYLLLLRAFKSILLPLKAIILDLISIAVAYASLVVVFKFGVGAHLFGTYQLDQIEAWVLIFLFAVLFGLSMDYEVFIASRMREAWDSGKSNKEAIVEGISETGGVVTAAAFILVAALAGLIGGHFAGLQELGVGLAASILIDVTVIRALVLPSAMALLGRWNWWIPKR